VSRKARDPRRESFGAANAFDHPGRREKIAPRHESSQIAM
jgi:hypothetical protein